MARYKDADWNLPEKLYTWNEAQVALLMDIRDELKMLNRVLNCPNFQEIPTTLRRVAANTHKPKKRRAAKPQKGG